MGVRDSDIDIDRIVDYKSEYSQVIRKAKVTGDRLVGLCPFHKDSDASFTADLKTGQWNCFTEDIGGNFISFYAKIHGVENKEAYKDILDKYGILQEEAAAVKKPKSGLASYSLDEYAFNKRLPVDWLKEHCHLETAKGRDQVTYLKVPYYGYDKQESTYRKRYGHKEFRWKFGSSGKIIPYGTWRIPEFETAGYVCMVEGESDTQTLWYMDVPALGIAGASLFKIDQAAMLQNLKLYLHIEPDRGGETFLASMTSKLREAEFPGEVYTWSCKMYGAKDPSELFIKYGKEDAAKKIGRALRDAKKIDLNRLEDVIPETIKGAPVNLRQPEGWLYSEKGISKIDEKKMVPSLVCRTPIILTQRLRSLETGEEKIEIAFKRDNEWHRAIFPRSTIFTARGITVLADLGCTVTSENAKLVVSFLSALEAENIDIIQKADATNTFGWQPGNRFLPGHARDIVLDVDPTQRGQVAAYCLNGTMEGWKATMEPHRHRDKFRFILAASFTAPLLRIIRQRIFFVYNWGGSKGGKTAALKAALSAWGDPDRLMINFNATQVALERMAGFYCDLPLGIDERQLAGRNQDSMEKIVYMLASGTGKARGSKGGGLQAMQTWRTVAIATGEEPISTETSQTGVSTRILEIYGGPFDNERDASMMHQQAPMNCGWAGEEYIALLLKSDEETIRTKYEEMVQYVYEQADGKSGSHIAGIAAVALADALIDSWIFKGLDELQPESWQRAQLMAKVVLQEQLSATGADVNENATQFIVDWIMSNRMQFGERAIGTCLGMMQGDKVYIFPSLLTNALTKAGYSARKTMKYLADNGLISSATKSNGGKEYSVIKWFGNRSHRFVEFHLGKLIKEKDPLIDEEEIARDLNIANEGFKEVVTKENPFKQETLDLPY